MQISNKPNDKQKLKPEEQELWRGIEQIQNHTLFGNLPNRIILQTAQELGKDCIAVTAASGDIFLNRNYSLSAAQWAYGIAHCALHHVFGHFDLDHVPGVITEQEGEPQKKTAVFDPWVWNMACDVFLAKFLADMKLGQSLVPDPLQEIPGSFTTETEIYDYLLEYKEIYVKQRYGTAAENQMDMRGLEKPLVYTSGNPFTRAFSHALTYSVEEIIDRASRKTENGLRQYKSPAVQASEWFLDHYPLLGGLAASFQIVEDHALCHREQIQVAAIDVDGRKIYVNPAIQLNRYEWQFVLAHEYLHAGLSHATRCQGRDPVIWNLACDFVINGWLVEMQIGVIPKIGILYDPALANHSAESIYDLLMENLRKSRKLATFRGYGMGDILLPEKTGMDITKDTVTMDELCREALLQGLDYHQSSGRGLIPAGLVQEIRALAMPPVPWDVKLGNWFQTFFPTAEKHRSYARPSRRQSATPDIPRPGYVTRDEAQDQKTFGVIVDTSGSMSTAQIGLALGAIASYAAEREVPYARVVFCDAAAYDAGYLSSAEIADRVQVKGRGGTRLQPAVDLLEHADDFPKNGPILIITDGQIENRLMVRRKHAYLLPRGKRLPFQTKAEIFYYA